MTYESFKLDLKQIKLELQRAVVECSQRGLNNSAKWLAELNFALIDVKVDPQDANLVKENLVNNEADNYMLAKSYFDFQEYDRCAYFTEWCKSPLPRFLHLYSRYLSGEKKRLEDMRDTAAPLDHTQVSSLQDLASDLRKDYLNRSLDGYSLYLYGIVQKRLDLSQGALEVLVEATHKEPLHWGAWLELVTLITDRTKLDSLVLPDHWMKHFFLGHMYLDLQLNDDALNIYCMLRTQGFEKCHYILAQTAIVHHNNRDVDMAINTFRQLQKADPYRLENLDTYSNLLYVKDLKVELASLAHQACEIDKYRVETCCVIGNYYSLRTEHQKAVLYFQRALKRNPQYLSAWTLMGHEFMEMKNTNAAIQSYRKAIEINRRDYRAWYGLGQTYEILKMAHYCIYYYKQAQQLRPNDSRMLIALGETYEKLDKNTDAVKCYYRAHNVGDSEGTALLKVAKLFDKLNENEYAVAAYMGYVKESENRVIGDKSELYQAYKYLANHYLKVDQLEDAYQFAQKCLECEETKEEGKALLRSIAQKRSQLEESDMQMEDGTPSSQVRNRVSESSSNQSSLMNLTFG